MKHQSSFVLAASTLALLSACGGGGSDSSSHPSADSLAITATNQNAVARATVTGAMAVAQTQGATADSSSPSNVTTRAHALDAALRRALTAGLEPRRAVASASTRPAAVTSNPANCSLSGSLTTTFDDRDSNGVLSAGDVVSVTFNQCRDSATSTFNGAVVVTLTGAQTATQTAASTEFRKLTIIDGGLSSSVDGTVAFTETDSDTESDTTITVGSTGLAITVASTSYNDAITFNAGMRIVTNDQFTLARTSTALDGKFSAQSLGNGAVTIATLSPVVQRDADAYPFDGVVRVTGLSGSKLLMTVMNTTQVQLQLDVNGDGTYEGTTTVAWTTLVPQ